MAHNGFRDRDASLYERDGGPVGDKMGDTEGSGRGSQGEREVLAGGAEAGLAGPPGATPELPAPSTAVADGSRECHGAVAAADLDAARGGGAAEDSMHGAPGIGVVAEAGPARLKLVPA
jgi:hypothetical protein